MKRPAIVTLVLLLALASLPSCRGNRDRTVEEKLTQAKQLEQDGRADEAYPLYEAVVALAPCHEEAFLRLGIADYTHRDFAKAGERFENCVRCNRDHLLCWERLAWVREKLSMHEEAAHAYREAGRLKPDREFMDGEGRALLQAGKLEEAAGVFRKIRQTHPEDHRAVYFLANILLRQGEKEQARELYEQAIEMRPVLVEAYVNLASILFGEAKYAEAASLMERTFDAVPMDAPFDSKLRYNIALCWFKAGDRKRAEMHLRKYLDLDPEGNQAEAARRMLESLVPRDAYRDDRKTPVPSDP